MSDGAKQAYAVKVRPEKVEAIEQIKGDLNETQVAVVTEYRGLTVPALAELREKLGAAESSYRVVKNTLARRAVSELGIEELSELFVGPVAVAYCKGDPVTAAKIIATFAKDHPELVIKGGVLEGRFITGEEAKGLATIDTLDVSRAKIAGLLTAALRQIAMIAQAPAQRILYVLEELGKRGPAADEAPAAEETPASEEAPASEAPTEEAPAEEPAEAPAAEATAEPAAEASAEPAAEAAPEAEAAPAAEESADETSAEQGTQESTEKEGE